MSIDRVTDTYQQLDTIWSGAEAFTLPIAAHKYVVMSDLHLGNGGNADNFIHNRRVFLEATRHYFEEEYHLILAGDTEELWQFDLDEVTQTYRDTVYSRLQQFSDAKRLTRIFGNHDRDWASIVDPAFSIPRREDCSEAVKLTDYTNSPRILILHGHQGSAESDQGSWYSKFFVRLYRYIEPVFHCLSDDPAATRSFISKAYERRLYGWAKTRHVLLICGHSHRAVAASLSYTQFLQRKKAELQARQQALAPSATDESLPLQLNEMDAAIAHERKRGRNFTPVEETGAPIPCYFNSGCCCYTDGLTAIEIDADQIALVKCSPQRVVFQSMPLAQCLTPI